MTTIRRRLDDLQAARARQQQRKGKGTYLEDMREWLQSIDGQTEIGTIPDEGIYNEMVRRIQIVDGWNLGALPGDTNKQRDSNAELIARGELIVSDEARHAARHWIGIWEKVL